MTTKSTVTSIERASGVTSRNLTDTGNAKRMAQYFGEFLRYCATTKTWFVWDGARWAADDRNAALACTAKTIAKIYIEAAKARAGGDADFAKALAKHAKDSESASRRRAMLELARGEAPFPITPSDLDRDPFLITVENGTIDLNAGKLREHRRTDMITKLAPVEFIDGATAPLWLKFLERVLPDGDVRAYVQRFAGYCLTGDVGEHQALLLYGVGRNGKTTLFRTLLSMLGDYGATATEELLLADPRGSRHPTEVAMLFGLRLAVASEIDQGRAFAEARLKSITGGDPITARGMHQDPWTFEPTHKLIVASNHKPIVRGDDDGIWSRIALVPFTVTIPEEERDHQLSEKLRAELPGILNWALAGLQDWRAQRLNPPAAVRAASKEYREEQDSIGRFLEECCTVGESETCTVSMLRSAYEGWCKQSGEHPISGKALTQRLRRRGIDDARTSIARSYRGVSVRLQSARTDADDRW